MPLLLLVLAVIGLVLAAGAWARARLKGKYAPPGRMVDVGGYRLHLQCQGEGTPAVVIDAGQGDFSLGWQPLLPRIAEFTRVCVYDRAGLGWSDPSPRPRTVEVMVEELRTLLDRADVPRPYVLVGHSIGGMNVRLFAHKYPEAVVGLVLVDASHEEQFSAPAVQQALRQMSRMMPLMYGGLGLLVRSGIAALKPSLLPDPSGVRAKLPPEAAPVYDAVLLADARHVATAAAELKALDETHAQMRAAGITTLGDIPIVVLRHGLEQPMMASPEVTQALEETFERLQREMAALSTSGRLVVAEQSGHAIHLDQPDLVVDAVRQVVEAARAAGDRRPQTADRGPQSADR